MRISSLLREIVLPALYLTTILGLILYVINQDTPKVGHDYGFFIPRMLDTHLHHKVNGLAIQWYTANFGAGTPAYPNPQYIQYSLPQLSMLVVNPWLSLMFSLAAYAAIGFTCFYLFLREEMGWIGTASALGASFILVNGFFIEHAIVGHVGFQHFPLFGAILFLAFTKRMNVLPAGILIGLVIAAIVNQAGFIILIIFILSSLIIFPMLYLLRPELFSKKLLAALLTGGFFSVLLSISKVSIVLAFMRTFPRVIEDDYGQTYLQGILGILKQLTAFNLLLPYYFFTGRDLKAITTFFQQGAGAQFGAWELNIFLAPGLLLLLVLGSAYLVFVSPKTRPVFSPAKAVAALALLLGIWLAVDMTLAQGWLYGLVKPLPVLRSLHANVRFASAFIFPLALLGAFIFHELFKDKKTGSTVAFALLGVSTLAILSMYVTMPDVVHNRSFHLGSALPIYARIDKEGNFTLQDVAEITDMEVFVLEDSNLTPQDPIFGYEGEFFEPKATVGPIMELQAGTYNLTNPAGYVFPVENGVQPFDLFRADQTEDLELFINHKQPNLEISNWQEIANLITMAALVLSVMYLIFVTIKGSMKSWQMNIR